MAGIRRVPIATTVAALDPEMAANNMQLRTAVMPSPPGSPPTTALAASVSRRNASASAAASAEFAYLCVPTPQGDDGSADLTYVRQAAADIGPTPEQLNQDLESRGITVEADAEVGLRLRHRRLRAARLAAALRRSRSPPAA
jgi:hypothetical protein